MHDDVRVEVLGESTSNPLAAKHAEWSKTLFGDDPNSIGNQIDNLVSELACFMMLNYAGGIAFYGKSRNRLRIHSLVINTIRYCLRDSLMLRIRQLSESKPTNPKKEVHSLRALLNDMKANAALLTRSNILSVEAIPYNPPTWDESPQYHCFSTQRHEAIDRLTGANSECRQPVDRIQAPWFERRDKWLDRRSIRVKNFVDKYIAHAATPASRAEIRPDEMRVTHALVWNATATICTIANELRVDVLGDNELVPIPPLQPIDFAHECDDLADLEPDLIEDFWGRLVKKVERWYGRRPSKHNILLGT